MPLLASVEYSNLSPDPENLSFLWGKAPKKIKSLFHFVVLFENVYETYELFSVVLRKISLVKKSNILFLLYLFQSSSLSQRLIGY